MTAKRTLGATFVLAALATACGASPQDSTAPPGIAPLVVSSDTASLLGTFDPATRQVWLTSNATRAAQKLVAAKGVQSSQIVIVAEGKPYAAPDGVVTLPAGVDATKPLRACIVDTATATRWRIADFRVAGADALALANFVPTELAVEQAGQDLSICDVAPDICQLKPPK
jgi:hypothetical protein